MRQVVFACVLVLACGRSHEVDTTPMGRAKQEFGPHTAVQQSSVTVPGAQIFVARPDPSPADYDHFDALLLPDQDAAVRGSAAVRFAWDKGVHDAAPLAHVAAIFLGDSEQVAGEKDKQRAYVQGRENIQEPAIANNQLVFYEVRGSMSPTAERVVVDLASFEVVRSR